MRLPSIAIASSLLATGLLLLAQEPSATPPAAEVAGGGLTFVYIHGFGGAKEQPAFCENMREFLSDSGADGKVLNYQWDSVKVDPVSAGASWLKAQKRADQEAAKFRAEVIDKLESEGEPYVIVGFSVGSRVVLRALEERGEKLEHLAGVYFLGSAMTKDTTIAESNSLPEGMRITNYHSPSRDVVHSTAFKFMSETPAGGQVGFDDEDLFANHAVSCAHAHKGFAFHIDYSGLAEAIGALELYRHGVDLGGRTKANLETRVGEGDLWWNKIVEVKVEYDGREATVQVEQHNMRPGYYRALRLDADGERRRVARGESLHAILRELGVEAGR